MTGIADRFDETGLRKCRKFLSKLGLGCWLFSGWELHREAAPRIGSPFLLPSLCHPRLMRGEQRRNLAKPRRLRDLPRRFAVVDARAEPRIRAGLKQELDSR